MRVCGEVPLQQHSGACVYVCVHMHVCVCGGRVTVPATALQPEAGVFCHRWEAPT